MFVNSHPAGRDTVQLCSISRHKGTAEWSGAEGGREGGVSLQCEASLRPTSSFEVTDYNLQHWMLRWHLIQSQLPNYSNSLSPSPTPSHTRTIVRECCKGDDQSQWRRANFDPLLPLNPLTDHHQNLHRWLRRGYLPPCKILFRSDKGFRFRACATSRTNVYSAIFWVLTITYSQDATTDINAKYIKRRGSAQGCAFWGPQNQNLTSTAPFSPKTAILGPDLDGT